ncbi:MAG: polymer-forming cytoskeletal protein [Bacteroidales bacterium]|nr:polymer-forming cytoskeletal protein [Bacteroidales bacterium]
MSKTFEVENKLPNIIGTGTKFKGDIDTDGDLRVDGSIEGNIISKGKVVLGQGGSIKGAITCYNAEIAGIFEGKVEVTEQLALKSCASFNGDMNIGKLSIEPGAVFVGNCCMTGNDAPQQAAADTDADKD